MRESLSSFIDKGSRESHERAGDRTAAAAAVGLEFYARKKGIDILVYGQRNDKWLCREMRG